MKIITLIYWNWPQTNTFDKRIITCPVVFILSHYITKWRVTEVFIDDTYSDLVFYHLLKRPKDKSMFWWEFTDLVNNTLYKYKSFYYVYRLNRYFLMFIIFIRKIFFLPSAYLTEVLVNRINSDWPLNLRLRFRLNQVLLEFTIGSRQLTEWKLGNRSFF